MNGAIANIPPAVRSQIELALLDRTHGRVTAASIHRRFKIGERYGMGLRSFQRHVRGFRKSGGTLGGEPSGATPRRWQPVVERRLRPDVLADVNAALREPASDRKPVAAIWRLFRLERRGVSRSSFYRHAQHVQQGTIPARQERPVSKRVEVIRAAALAAAIVRAAAKVRATGNEAIDRSLLGALTALAEWSATKRTEGR